MRSRAPRSRRVCFLGERRPRAPRQLTQPSWRPDRAVAHRATTELRHVSHATTGISGCARAGANAPSRNLRATVACALEKNGQTEESCRQAHGTLFHERCVRSPNSTATPTSRLCFAEIRWCSRGRCGIASRTKLIDELLAGARSEEEIVGPGGVLAQLTKRLVERAAVGGAD